MYSLGTAYLDHGLWAEQAQQTCEGPKLKSVGTRLRGEVAVCSRAELLAPRIEQLVAAELAAAWTSDRGSKDAVPCIVPHIMQQADQCMSRAKSAPGLQQLFHHACRQEYIFMAQIQMSSGGLKPAHDCAMSGKTTCQIRSSWSIIAG